MRSQIKRKRRVTAAIFAQLLAIDRHRGRGHHSGKIHENAFAFELIRQTEMASINRDELVLLLVESMPGKYFIGVRDGHPFELRVVEFRRGTAGRDFPAEKPIPV